MSSKSKQSIDNFDPEFNHALPLPERAAEATTRNLTQEALEAFFKQKKSEAEQMENPPKDLMKIDPAKRAAEMVRA